MEACLGIVNRPMRAGDPVVAIQVRQLRDWRKRLLDISQSNPLLGLNRARVSKLQVKTPSAPELFSKRRST